MLLVPTKCKSRSRRDSKSNFEYELSKHPSEAPKVDDRKPVAKSIKKEPEDEALSWSQEEMTQ